MSYAGAPYQPEFRVAAPHQARERRDFNSRPSNGDVKPCVMCGSASEFSERFRFEGRIVPAWVCDSAACLPEIVRRSGRSDIAASHQLRQRASRAQAKARWTVMKSKAAVARVEKRLKERAQSKTQKRR